MMWELRERMNEKIYQIEADSLDKARIKAKEKYGIEPAIFQPTSDNKNKGE